MRLLDLFCGAGGVAMGYYKAGFDEIVGVDIIPQPNYPFDFIQANALNPPMDFDDFDLVHASPPCQRYSNATPKSHRSKHPDLISDCRDMLKSKGTPYVIENVAGARKLLKQPIMLCGTMFGLRSWRHRYFEVCPPISPLTPSCDHSVKPLLVTTAGSNSRAIRKPGEYKSVKNAPLAYDIDWMTTNELKEAIPPAYTEWIGKRIIQSLPPEA